jgi:hypothetical protein
MIYLKLHPNKKHRIWGSHDRSLLGCNAVVFGDSPTFRRKYRLHLHGRRVSQQETIVSSAFSLFLLVSCFAYCWTGKVRQCFSETSGSLLSTQHCSLQARALHYILHITARNSCLGLLWARNVAVLHSDIKHRFSIGAAFRMEFIA